MGFIGWLRRVAGGAVHSVADVVHLVRVGLAGLWHVLGNLGGVVGKAWRRFGGAVGWLARWLEEFASAVATRIRHILLVVIPHAITHVLTVAANYARRLANTVEAWARSALRYLRDELVSLLHTLEAWARSAVRWLTSHVAQIANDLAKTARRVWSLLDSPAHLAEWVVGAMVGALGRWATRNVVRIGRWVVRAGAHAVIESVPTVEDWIARIL